VGSSIIVASQPVSQRWSGVAVEVVYGPSIQREPSQWEGVALEEPDNGYKGWPSGSNAQQRR